jgi:DNA-binding NarL/FixJ family response regulator
MDIQMPEMNGFDALIAIRTEFPDAKVVVLTTYEGDVRILRALKAGAQGYLLNANKQIADRLAITEDTVKGRVKSILAKLDANDRTHAAIIGLKRGIIEL